MLQNIVSVFFDCPVSLHVILGDSALWAGVRLLFCVCTVPNTRGPGLSLRLLVSVIMPIKMIALLFSFRLKGVSAGPVWHWDPQVGLSGMDISPAIINSSL